MENEMNGSKPDTRPADNTHCPKCGTHYEDCPNSHTNDHGQHMCANCFADLPDNLQEAFYL